ncbi:hypothetical protein AOR13_2895 [Alteromonas stellipolaris LMG 21856]|nr:hypothetical protein AOR13_2895 [Alteromonas stellipolaris LMG 21856]
MWLSVDLQPTAVVAKPATANFKVSRRENGFVIEFSQLFVVTVVFISRNSTTHRAKLSTIKCLSNVKLA